jgi:hypothetical protein
MSPSPFRRPSPLCAAALLHLCVCAAVVALGAGRVLPGALAEGGLTLPMTPDQGLFRDQAAALRDALLDEGPGPFLRARAQLHVKLYALSFCLLPRHPLAAGALGAEPLNLAYYLAILALVRSIGAAAFAPRTGRLAALVVALWPSFLLTTTQLLRDPLFITLILVLLRANLALLGGAGPRRSLAWGAAGAASILLLWIVRWDMQEVTLCLCALGVLCALATLIRARRLLLGPLLGAILLIGGALSAPRVTEASQALGLFPPKVSGLALRRARPAGPASAPRPGGLGSTGGAVDALAQRAGRLRAKFLREYPNEGSNLDAEVRLRDAGDLLRFLPRALSVGLFAPFPRYWFARGARVGNAGRLLAGVETLCLYAIEALGALALLRLIRSVARRGAAEAAEAAGADDRRLLAAALLLCTSLIALLALGTVVPNLGALYRLRYAFLIPLIVLGAHGVRPNAIYRGGAGLG